MVVEDDKTGGHANTIGPLALGSTKKTQLPICPCISNLSGVEEVPLSVRGVWFDIFSGGQITESWPK